MEKSCRKKGLGTAKKSFDKFTVFGGQSHPVPSQPATTLPHPEVFSALLPTQPSPAIHLSCLGWGGED